jgi:hypothetical protein
MADTPSRTPACLLTLLFYEIQRKRPVGQKLVDVFDLSEGLFETVKAGIRLPIRKRMSARYSFVPWPAEYRVSG